MTVTPGGRMRFAITHDYLCPFARNAAEHVLDALEGGADWQVEFLPYSLAQGHVEEGDTDVWERDDPYRSSGILALAAGVVVRDQQPDRFLAAHRALFAARHDEGLDLRDRDVVRGALLAAEVDVDAVLDRLDDGLETVRKEHERGVHDHEVWGVPTFIAGQRAVFVRLLDRPGGDAAGARRRIERIIELVTDFPELHEFKQTDLPV